MIERRKAERLQIYLSAKWEGVLGFATGTIGDMSTGGCYVMTGGNVKEKELIRLEIQLPTEELLLWGEVNNAVPEIGFGLRFTMLDDEGRIAIEKMFAHVTTHGGRVDTEEAEIKTEKNASHAPSFAGPLPPVNTPLDAPIPERMRDDSPLTMARKSVEYGLEIAQLRELPVSTRRLIGHTLSELRQLINEFETRNQQKELEQTLTTWFKLVEGCIGILPYGEMRRALRNAATIIRHAYDMHAVGVGMTRKKGTNPRYIEEYFQLEGISAAERPDYLIETFVFSYYDLAVKIGQDAGILPADYDHQPTFEP